MASKLQKASCQKSKVLSDLLTENEMENEKENKYSKQFVLKGKKTVKEKNTKYVEEKKLREDELLSSRLKSNVTIKPLGFWKKKLQDLEESITNKKCKLYEFSGTDESESSYKTEKKKPKQKNKLKKKKEAAAPPSYNKPVDQIRKLTEKKLKQIHRQSMCREQIMLTKERKKLANTGKRFTFSVQMPSLGITSTPTVKKDNLVGASKFLFLSPIIMEEETENNKLKKSSAHKSKDAQNNLLAKHLDQETPKIETKLKTISCIRVLRSGKIINM